MESMKRAYGKYIIILILGLFILVGGFAAWHQHQKQVFAREQQARQEALEAAAKAEEEEQQQKKAELEAEAEAIADKLEAARNDEAVCSDIERAALAAENAKASIDAYRTGHEQEEEELISDALLILEKIEKAADTILAMQSIDEQLSLIYDAETDYVAMSTAGNNRVFQEVQQDIWNLSGENYPGKMEIYENAVVRISEAWNYTNDEWNYESATLRVSVEPRETSYTKYWVCHVRTFSTQQLCSALCGGTYGNPRVATSVEVAAHNGVIGINGSGFSYGSGIPAEGKSMIKEGVVYSDIYSNGNIMCVTQDGGMFTAIAGMTTEDMLNRGVRDTYCFGPTLVENGEPYEITPAFQQTYRYQRTAVGMVNPGDYYIVIVDGKGVGGSQGMTYEELRDVFLELGCEYAYNLDGGGSTTLVFKGRIINSLTDGGRERPCSDILYFIDAGDGGEGDDIIVHEEEAMLRPPGE